LWDILHDGAHELNVADGVDLNAISDDFIPSGDTSLGTDDVNPSPPTTIAPRVRALGHDRHHNHDHGKQTSTDYSRHRLRDSLPLADPKAPQHIPELTVSYQGEDDSMRRECQIVESHRRLRAERVARRVLPSDERGGQEARGRDGVAYEAEDVDGGIIDRETVGGAPVIVEDELRIEGGRPTQEAVGIRSSQHAPESPDVGPHLLRPPKQATRVSPSVLQEHPGSHVSKMAHRETAFARSLRSGDAISTAKTDLRMSVLFALHCTAIFEKGVLSLIPVVTRSADLYRRG